MIDTLSIRGAYRGKTFPETTIQILCDEIDRLRGEQQTPQWREQSRSGDCLTCVHKMKDWQMEPCRECEGQNYSRATLPVPAEVCVVARVEANNAAQG